MVAKAARPCLHYWGNGRAAAIKYDRSQNTRVALEGPLLPDDRRQDLFQWSLDALGERGPAPDTDPASVWSPVAGDASFRRFFRLQAKSQTFIAIDAPPRTQDSRRFVAISDAFEQHGVRVPDLLSVDHERGFLLQSDFGDALLMDELSSTTVDGIYATAMDELLRIQECEDFGDFQLPDYDEGVLQQEMSHFKEWFLQQCLNYQMSAAEQEVMAQAQALLIRSAIDQPQVCVHRDYHSRNLLLLKDDGIGVIDFQDAVRGPITYDLVSLLRDCYVEWPQQQVNRWVETYLEQLRQTGLIDPELNLATFTRWFDLMGMQRHLKAIGLFCRLKHRDHKPGYIKDIPRTLNYVLDVCSRYPELADLHVFLQDRVSPLFVAQFPELQTQSDAPENS